MKKLLSNTLSIILPGILFLSQLSASNFYFKNYKVEDGLTQNTVFCVLQDQQGFIWLGTNDGLNRFDGYNFKVYRKSTDTTSIGNSKISCMIETKDQCLYVGTAIGIYVYNPKTESFKFFNKTTSDRIAIRSRINSIAVDAQNKLWIATNEQGFFIYNPATEQLQQVKHDANNPAGLPSNQVNRVFIDSKQNVWVACQGLYRYQPSSNQFKKIVLAKEGAESPQISKFYEDNNSDLWIGTTNYGLQKFNRERETFTAYFDQSSSYFIPHIHDLIEFSSNVLAIGSNSGLITFNTITESYGIIHASKEKGGLSDNSIYCFYQDKEGAFWLGTYFGGVNYLYSTNQRIELYTHREYENSVSGSAISRFYEDETGNIWIAMEGAGLDLFDIASKRFTQYLSNHNIQSILIDNDEMWLGSYGGGILVFDKHSKKYKKTLPVIESGNISGLLIKSIVKDSFNNIWVGTTEGLFLYDRPSGQFNLIQGTGNIFVWDIIEDKNNEIWFVSSGSGAFKYNLKNGKLKNYLNKKNDKQSISDNFILTICKDGNKDLWFGTEENGFCKYNYETDNFKQYNNFSKFSNRLIYAIVADNYNCIWFSTSNGLFRFNPENEELKIYTIDEGLQSNQFNFNSGFKASSGKLYFGGVDGFNSFFPEDLKENTFVPPVHITNFQIFNKDITIGEKNSLLKQSLSYTDKIVLNHKQNVFNFEFVSLSFVHPGKNQYAYKMEGFDKDWNYTDEHKVTYTSLPPGKYIFKVKGSNNDGIWNEEGVSIMLEIKPPFWETGFALFLYIFIILGILFWLNRRYVLRERKKQKYALEKTKTEKELELYNSKMNFFTNIAHEIKTPLSLIKAPLEKIMNNNNISDEELKSDLKIIERNTDQLHTLITQLLDFRKMESGSMQAHFLSVNISELVENVYLNFKTAAEQKGIDFILTGLTNDFHADIDKDALTKILMNLISNAMKFTKNKIEIALCTDSLNKNNFQIKVKDNGAGIPDAEKNKIFLPFKQISNGNKDKIFGGVGLGLSYSRSLAELHSGSLIAEDNVSEGTTFILSLPVKQENTVPTLTDKKNIEEEKESEHKEKKAQSLLIIEDNDDMRDFLYRSFSHDYIVHTAIHGKDALNILNKETPDLIITDLMMPVMDGIEFAKILKNDVNKSHIPLIMLTAKTMVGSKIEGYSAGTDSYIEKPFSIDLLKTRVINLFENRDKIRTNYARSPYVQSISIANNKIDEEFIIRMKNVIMQHIQDENFTVDELASYMYMSRSGLFAKIKGISGMSPLDYIKTERLKRSAELLAEGKYSISEIALMVGYSTPSYFSKAFQKQFGVLPKDFKKV